MAYDVFLVSALADRDVAKLVARRLRALKFKVWLDQKQTDETFDAKDARDATNSQSMLVLWSKDAVQSDWVRAAASIGHSRPGTLIQTSLDKTIPYEPFKKDKRYAIAGMTSRKTPEGFYQVVEELGGRHDREDLQTWMRFKSSDEDEKDDWLKSHPADPLALHAEKQRQKKLGVKPAPAAAAAGAAALAAAAVGGMSGAAKANMAVASPMKAAVVRPVVANAGPSDAESIGWGTIGGISVSIGLMLLLGWVFRSEPLPTTGAGMPAIANSYRMMEVCPEGTLPQSLLKSRTLEPGPIINDTE